MYGVRLFRVVNELKKYPELRTIRIRHDLPVQSISTLQKLAKCMGIHDSQDIDLNSKDPLIQIHAEILFISEYFRLDNLKYRIRNNLQFSWEQFAAL